MGWMISLFVLLSLVCNVVMFKQWAKRDGAKRGILRGVLFAVSTLLVVVPYVTWVYAFFVVEENDTALMQVMMWMAFAIFALVMPMLVMYAVIAIGRFSSRAVWVGAAVGVVLCGVAVKGVFDRRNLVVRSVEIQNGKLPQSFDGYRIALVSDLHIGSLVEPESELQVVVERLNSLGADLAVIGGDVINIRESELDSSIMSILSSIRAKDGVVSVVGNHDTGYYIRAAHSDSTVVAQNTRRLIDKQRRMGWRVLYDESEYMVRGEDSISITGLAFKPDMNLVRHSHNDLNFDFGNTYRGVDSSMFNVTVSHLPQLWDEITVRGYGDVTLAGHVHSMQMKLTLGSWSISAAQWLYKQWSGRYDNGGSTLYINDGIGYVGFPMRIGALPEITLITLTR